MNSDLQRLDGLFVGLLNDEEIELFERAIEKGEAMRWYQGVGGFMGLAKVLVCAPRRVDIRTD